MKRIIAVLFWFLSVVAMLSVLEVATAQSRPVVTNDNLSAAGVLTGQRLAISLVAETGLWFPGGEGTHGIEIQAFREERGALQIPGPMIRVEVGTEIVATIRNNIPDSELHLHGLQSSPEDTTAPIRVPYGESRDARFIAGQPGVHFYAGTTLARDPHRRTGIDSQLSGAFVVDEKGASAEDRVFVLGEYLRGVIPDVTGAQTVINGRSWPNTEALEVETGKTNRWHVINTSFGPHPMHLHGQHFRVVAGGEMNAYEQIAQELRAEVVTTVVPTWGVSSIEWQAVHAGNWLFHCHISGHVGAAHISNIGDVDIRYLEGRPEGMGGMVLAIKAVDDGVIEPERSELQREITMLIELDPDEPTAGEEFTISFVQGGEVIAESEKPGPVLLLQKDEKVGIEIVNRLNQATSVHWHGMELESYYDGVAGFSGNGGSITPLIQPGESFTAVMAPPRAGTYFYHSHHNDISQMAAGLYGAVLVSDTGERFDAASDRVFVVGALGSIAGQRLLQVGINGSANHQQQFQSGMAYRLRLINILANNAELGITLRSDEGPENWLAIAKDGADLPPALQLNSVAEDQLVSVGEAYDFEWQPELPGSYWLEIRQLGNGVLRAKALLRVE